MPTLTVRHAACKLIEEGFECHEDLDMPHLFQWHYYPHIFNIIGPKYSKQDEIVPGIYINLGLQDRASVIIKPFPEFEERRIFMFADPEFPINLFHYVGNAIATWMFWWDIFEEERRLANIEDYG